MSGDRVQLYSDASLGSFGRVVDSSFDVYGLQSKAWESKSRVSAAGTGFADKKVCAPKVATNITPKSSLASQRIPVRAITLTTASPNMSSTRRYRIQAQELIAHSSRVVFLQYFDLHSNFELGEPSPSLLTKTIFFGRS